MINKLQLYHCTPNCIVNTIKPPYYRKITINTHLISQNQFSILSSISFIHTNIKYPSLKRTMYHNPPKYIPKKNNSNLPSDWSKLPISQSFQPSLYFPKNNSLNDLYSLYLLNHFHSPIEMSAKRTLIYSIISRGYSISQISTSFQFLVMLSYVRKPPEPWTTSPLVTLLRSPWAFFPSSPLLASTLSTMMSMFFVESLSALILSALYRRVIYRSLSLASLISMSWMTTAFPTSLWATETFLSESPSYLTAALALISP